MIMTVTADTLSVSRKGMLAFIAAFTVLLSVFSITTPTARAAETKGEGRSSTPDAGGISWTPEITPVYWDRELVYFNMSTTQRNHILHNCPTYYLCVAAGEGDGDHSIYLLYYCAERTLSNFLGDGAIFNNQVGVPQVGLADRNKKYTYHDVDIRGIRVDWDPVYYLKPC